MPWQWRQAIAKHDCFTPRGYSVEKTDTNTFTRGGRGKLWGVVLLYAHLYA